MNELFHAALPLAPSDREAFLSRECDSDKALRVELESLLAAHNPAASSDGSPALRPGVRLGDYELTSFLAAGGMGEVYRARDLKLEREVALKILPTVFVNDSERRARFEREARLLASLNHPNIATIYGFVESSGVAALALELVEGETLEERIARGQLSLAEAARLAAQVADALEAAHQKGIVHRDLKPANIKVTRGGTLKVLDFGLGKLVETAPEDRRDSKHRAADAGLSLAPTVIGELTGRHVLLGTPAYMSPEQARCQPVDRRTDIWSFGCIVYEMLTGRRPFCGDTVSDVIALALHSEPDWSLLPAATPSTISTMVRRCLEKDRTKRLQDIGEARVALTAAGATTNRDHARSRRVGRRAMAVMALALVAAASIAVVRWLSVPVFRATGETTRLSVAFPADQELNADGGAAALAISPDGRRVVYAADTGGRTALYARRLDAFASQALPGTDGARYPFFSPDGQWVAFFRSGKLMRVPLDGRSPIPVCDAPLVGHGGTWGPDDTIVYDAGQSGLMRVAAGGGRPELLTSSDPNMDRRDFQWPQFLPDGSGLVATLVALGPQEPSTIAAFSFARHQWRNVIEGSQPTYVPPGFLVFHAERVHEGELQVVRFDPIELTTRGTPASFQTGVFRARGGGAVYFAVSPSGTLVFAPGGYNRSLVRVDRNGRRSPVTNDRRGFRFPRLSPDGRRVAVTIDPRPSEIWVYDLERGTRIPLTSGRNSVVPVWTSDGRQVVYTTANLLYMRNADGSSPERPLVEATAGGQYAHSSSRDGRFLFFHRQQAESKFDLWVLPAGGAPRPLVVTSARELHPAISPDARWLAYDSDESGRYEIYIRPFPQVDTHRWPISTDGGHSPQWSRDGRELYYMNGASLMAVPVRTDGISFVAGVPSRLFDGPFDVTQDDNFDIFPDGTHFLMVEADPAAALHGLQVVLNWSAEIDQLLTR